MLDPKTFRIYLHNWALERGRKFKYYWPLKGGWELWIQVDLMAYIFEHNHLDDILRERPIYQNPRQRVDLLLNARGNPDDCIPVEIKAQSLNNSDDVFKGVLEDKYKLEFLRNDSYYSCECMLIAISFQTDEIRKIKDIKNDFNQRIFGTIISTGDVAILSATLDRERNWLPARRLDSATEETT